MGFLHKQSDYVVGVLVDIGSASVLVSYIASYPAVAKPVIIWSHREHVPLRSDGDIEQLTKNVSAALMSACLLLESTGRQVLMQALPKAPRPSYVSVTVAAPWSYTITKTISYRSEELFALSSEIFDQLNQTAERTITQELKEYEVIEQLGLATATKATLALHGNGYPITSATGQAAHSASVTHATILLREHLSKTLTETRNKLFPRAKVHFSSFMLGYYLVVRDLYPALTECCLVDVTYEATEIGIVRDGVLQYCTHTQYGSYSLARDLAEAHHISPSEATGYFSSPEHMAEDSSATSNFDHQNHYEQKIKDILRETGDTLAIPKKIILHSTSPNEQYFSDRLTKAASAVTLGSHHCIPITQEIMQRQYSNDEIRELTTRHDTALFISALFFHTHRESKYLEWL